MFERFTREARSVVIEAQAQARVLGHRRIGTEHLLLAMLAVDGSGSGLLQRRGITPEKVERAIRRYLSDAPGMLGPDDAAALKAIGIDLDEVRARLEENFGPVRLTPPTPPRRRRFGLLRGRAEGTPPGHIPFSSRAKKVLELSLREAIRLKQREIRAEHILLGLIREGEGLAALILTRAGVDLDALRRDAEAATRSEAA